MPRRNWYSIQAKAEGDEKVVEIRVYDEIGFWGTTAKAFTDRLDEVAADATRILVSINSPGGNVFDAFAIYNALARHKLPVTTRVDGVAASAASLIFMAGGERVMPENAMLMIHNAWTVAVGTADELRNTAEMMDRARNGIVAAYARSGQTEDEIIAMMNATTWMDALEAQSMGFATVMEEPVKLAACATAVDLLAQLKDVPQDLLAQLEADDKTTEPPSNDPPDADPPAAPPAEPPADPAPPPADPAPANAGNLVSHVYAECRARHIPHLAESVLVSSALTDKAAINARIEEAEQIAGICLAAKLQDRAAGFITAGLNVEQVRARLFEEVVTAANSVHISNLQRPDESVPTQSGPNPQAIYAARKAHSAVQR